VLADVRFLHVLQAVDAGPRPAEASVLRSVVDAVDGGEGQWAPYEGALVGGTAVLFPRDLGTPVDRVRYVVPTAPATGAITYLVTGLVPGAGYAVAFENVGEERRVTVTAGGAEVVADEAGVVRF